MSDLRLKVNRSSDGRYRTCEYAKGGKTLFCLAEKAGGGTLITEFYKSGEVANQIHYKEGDAEKLLSSYLGTTIETVLSGKYERVSVSAQCTGCKKNELSRELDLVQPEGISEVPVVPIFRCLFCGKRHYSMSKEYLRLLASRNPGLFDNEEIKEREKDEALFVNTLNEYVIRIFASKKISRLVVRE